MQRQLRGGELRAWYRYKIARPAKWPWSRAPSSSCWAASRAERAISSLRLRAPPSNKGQLKTAPTAQVGCLVSDQGVSCCPGSQLGSSYAPPALPRIEASGNKRVARRRISASFSAGPRRAPAGPAAVFQRSIDNFFDRSSRLVGKDSRGKVSHSNRARRQNAHALRQSHLSVSFLRVDLFEVKGGLGSLLAGQGQIGRRGQPVLELFLG